MSEFEKNQHSSSFLESQMPNITNNNQIDSLLVGEFNRWNIDDPVGTPATVTFSFAEALPTYADANDPENMGFTKFNDEQIAATRAILTRISNEFNITFNEVSDSADSYGQMRFYNNDQGEVSDGAAFPPFTSTDDAHGDLFMSNANPDNLTNIVPGTRAWSTMVHEIGHAIGLKHPGNYNAGDNSGAAADGPFLPASEDHVWYTVMSYVEAPQAQERDWFGILDLGALAYMYGKKEVATGDSNYVYTDATGSLLTMIDDAGGTDTIDLSQITLGATLNMSPGSLSSIGRSLEDTLGTNTLSIGLQAIIENAIGTPANDSITGNDSNNQLRGGAGDDTLAGGAGTDTAIFSGAKTAYTITNNQGTLSIQGTDGTDSLTAIERLQFDNVKVAFDLDANAGLTAKLLGVLAGKDSVANPTFVGAGINVLDSGMSYSDLMSAALDAVLGSGFSNDAVATLLYTNLAGAAPSSADLSAIVALIEGGTFTPVTLAIAAADHELNTTNIDIVGLASTGIDYV